MAGCLISATGLRGRRLKGGPGAHFSEHRADQVRQKSLNRNGRASASFRRAYQTLRRATRRPGARSSRGSFRNISVGVADPRILCEPFVSGAAEWTVCTAEEYRFAEERFTVHLDAGGYFPLCVRATDHHRGHRPLLFLPSFEWPTDPLRKRDESAVTIPRPCYGDRFCRRGMICGNGI
jgi:hypothetical protein